MNISLAIVLGLLFGFVLQKIGAANPQRIIGMLRLKDLHLLKTIFLGIGSSSLVLFALLALGVIDHGHLSVKSAYLGVLAGGVLFGLGWAISGFCPGTGLVAAGSGRKDAWSFIFGGLFGALVFMFIYAPLKTTFLFDTLGDKTTLAATGSSKFDTLLPTIPGVAIAGVIAIMFIVIAWKLPQRHQS